MHFHPYASNYDGISVQKLLKIASKRQKSSILVRKHGFYVKSTNYYFSESGYTPLKISIFLKGSGFSVFRHNPETYPKMNFKFQKLTKLSYF